MSQQQPERTQTDQEQIKYGDLFDVSDELAKNPIAPRDEALLQTAEKDATNISGSCVVTESAARQTKGKYPQGQGPITIGHALEAASITVGDRPVDQSDVAAIEEAEMRATQRNVVPPGGVGEEAKCAVARNAGLSREEDKTKLSDVLMDASEMMPRDKVVTPEDAEAVRNAEKSHNPKMSNYSGGVADMVTAAANINQRST